MHVLNIWLCILSTTRGYPNATFPQQKARNSAEAQRLYPGQVQEMQSLDEYIRGGTTVVISVVYNNKLYVANCGDSRALLCAEVRRKKGRY